MTENLRNFMQKIESDSILKEKVMELWGKNGKEFCDEIVDGWSKNWTGRKF